MKISHFSIKHPTIITIILIALLVFAAFSFKDIPLEFINDINDATIRIVTIYPGASASDVESDVTNILEDNFVTLNDYKSMTSQSSNSFSQILITFKAGIDPYEMLPEIRYRVTRLMDDLPSNIQAEPYVFVGGANMLPVISFTVEGGKDIVKLSEYAKEELKPQINHISGVSNVNIINSEELEVNIRLRLDDLTSKKISVTNIYQILQASNIKLAIGDTYYQEKIIDLKFEGNFKDLDDIKNLPVGFQDNKIIRLSDVADVNIKKRSKDYTVESLTDSLLVINVTKRLDGNVVEISRELKKIFKSEEAIHDNITFSILSDDSDTTNVAIRSVLISGLLGLLMAVFVILIFLNDSRATIIVALSIPISILITIIEMRIFNISLNVLSITGMVIALGMIVDGSIVMIEQVYKYYHQRNRGLNENILLAADQVGPSIFGSIMTSIVVYFPLLFLSGLIGQILYDTSIVLIFALSSSFIVAVVIVTFLMSKILKETSDEIKVRLMDKLMMKLTQFYKKSLMWCINSYKFIIISAISLLLISIYAITALGFSFIPSVDAGVFDIYLTFPRGYNLETTREKSLIAMKQVKEIVPEAKSIVLFSGDNGNLLGENPPNSSIINLVLSDVNDRERGIKTIMLETQKELASSLFDCDIRVANGGIDKLLSFATDGGDYGITLISEDLDILYSEAKRLENEIIKHESVVSTTLNTEYDSSTIVLDMNHEYLSNLGLSSYEAGLTSLILFNGIDVGNYHLEDGKTYNIHLDSNIVNIPLTNDLLSNINIQSKSSETISFNTFSTIKVNKSLSSINHSDRVREITVKAKLVDENTAPITSYMNKYLRENPLEMGVSSKAAGILDLINDAIEPMIYAIMIAIFLVFFVMVVQFENFRQPIIIMATIPFCVIGVVLSLLFFNTTMSLISMLGFFALSGLVVNNGIILIDNYNQRREKNNTDNINLIIIQGSSSRLRPILMTTLSTMFGVIPMAITKGVGSELYAPLGQSIAGGLITSTLISLYLIPVIYYLVEKRKINKANSVKKEKKHEKK